MFEHVKDIFLNAICTFLRAPQSAWPVNALDVARGKKERQTRKSWPLPRGECRTDDWEENDESASGLQEASDVQSEEDNAKHKLFKLLEAAGAARGLPGDHGFSP